VTANQPPSFPTGPSGPGGAVGPGPGAPQPAAPQPAAPPPSAPPAATAPPAAAAPAPGRSRSTGRAIGFTLAAALLVFVTVVLVLFVVFNTQTVDISLVFGNVQAPLVLALVIAAVLGGLVVGLAALALRARRSSR
jgi:uncharacterized integral membrane protein